VYHRRITINRLAYRRTDSALFPPPSHRLPHEIRGVPRCQEKPEQVQRKHQKRKAEHDDEQGKVTTKFQIDSVKSELQDPSIAPEQTKKTEEKRKRPEVKSRRPFWIQAQKFVFSFYFIVNRSECDCF
jgi:hypothetical protein